MDKTTQEQVLLHVAENLDNIPFKTLRLGEVELSDKEKLEQMKSTLESDPGLFLSKWGRHLSQSTLSLFECLQDDYEVNFYLSSLLYKQSPPLPPRENARQQKSALHTLSLNRRYEYLKRQLRHSDYFSDEAMQLREPELYEQFVGRHVPASEKNKPFENDVTLVNRILSNIDRKYVSDRLDEQRQIEEEQFEEEEEDTDDEDIKMKDVQKTPSNIASEGTGEADDGNIEEVEDEDIEAVMQYREEQRQELIRLLEEKFLAGKDDFDYTAVDYNEEYDDLDQQERDIQDKYFDEDDDLD
ncbi:hypothetical protein G6F70_007818 [Rhizopus microsporus]|uniref:Coiled-coil domain-containing protein 97 n=2 Tax=Rhizopus TaxID=4842 RepID=A0A367JUK5_RHIAZ|nr:hypothetical protein G6F71_007776 [Rhizopus microsporus]RCH93613.1 Coiled-coil domain-containing protein 97 [Rhizopus azygosporus]KAG1195974.1 hypothetical protein G6F70_007818 [Rhizopus microsporus]KAG1207857.1 hypothetical protein G6F69_007707 [Rhizopus microsporus]KAG1228764.1 hypothetical protein G6F67_007617 [Rhizopus microsporus]